MGMSLHHSLMTHAQPFHLWILCMDELVEEQLKAITLPQVSLISLKEIETPELLNVKTQRGRGEYCWTITPFTFTAVFEKQSDIERVTYIDADLYFFRNPQILLKEFDESGKDIFITEHGYAPEYDQTLLYGRFCVQFLTAKNNKAALSIIFWWQQKCLDWCYAKLEDGKFGDQKYLDIWTELFSQNVWILQQKENTLAPWNINHFSKYLGNKLNPVFYHFHSFRIVSSKIMLLFYGYKIHKVNMRFYKKYYLDLVESLILIKKLGFLVPYISLTDIMGCSPLKKCIKYILQGKIKFKIIPKII